MLRSRAYRFRIVAEVLGGPRRRAAPPRVIAAFVLGLAAAACTNDSGSTSPDEVTPADAYGAIIRWEVAEQEPVVDANGEEQLPVIFLATAGGGTIDIGVQAAVVESTVDEATVRFADDPSDAVDDGQDGEPVRNDGVMFVVANVPPAAPSVDVAAERYVTTDERQSLRFTIAASPDGAEVSEVDSD